MVQFYCIGPGLKLSVYHETCKVVIWIFPSSSTKWKCLFRKTFLSVLLSLCKSSVLSLYFFVYLFLTLSLILCLSSSLLYLYFCQSVGVSSLQNNTIFLCLWSLLYLFMYVGLLKNGPTPAPFMFIFSLFKYTIQFLQQINVKNVKMSKCPSSIWSWDSNPQPFEYESSPITTRPGLPPSMSVF